MLMSPMLLNSENQHNKSGNTIKNNLQIQCNPHQNTNAIIHRPWKKNNQLHMEKPKTQDSQNNPVQ